MADVDAGAAAQEMFGQADQIADLLSTAPIEGGDEGEKKPYVEGLETDTQTEQGDEAKAEEAGDEAGAEDLLPQTGTEKGSEKDAPADDPIAQLRAEISALREQLTSGKKDEPVAELTIEDVYKPATDLDFIGDDDVTEAFSDPAAFNKLLLRVYNKAREDLLRDIPAVVESASRRRVAYETAIDSFWKENSDLRGKEKYVSYIANSVAAEKPTWAIEQVLSETSERVRKDLGIAERAQQREDARTAPTKRPLQARPPRGTDRSASREQETELQKQLKEIL